jgi:hypothetical protein
VASPNITNTSDISFSSVISDFACIRLFNSTASMQIYFLSMTV